MNDQSAKDCLHSSGVGGPFYSLFAGLTGICAGCAMRFITPVLAPFTLTAALLSPALHAFFVRSGCSNGKDPAPAFKGFLSSLKQNWSFVLLVTLAWWVCIAGALLFFEYKSHEAMLIYEQAASEHQVLQIGTEEQQEHSHALVQTIAVSGLCLLLVFSLLSALSFAAVSKRRDPFITGFKAWGVNLPGHLLLAVIVVVAFAITEKYFAVLKLRYIEGLILKRDEFDPALTFIVLRIYILNAAATAAALMAAFSLKISAYGFSKRLTTEEKDQGQ